MDKISTRTIALTATISLLIFIFIACLVYSIYCYGYYDKHEEEQYAEKFNKREYNYVYDYLIKDNALSKIDFDIATSITLNQSEAERIYNEYYQATYSKQEFLNKYFFGNVKIKKNDITFASTGKTTYFKTRKLYYRYINLDNGKERTTLGVINNIKFYILKDTELYLDNNLICNNEICNIDKVYGGIHSVTYIKDNIKYYALINIKEDNVTFDIDNLDNLISISIVNEEEDIISIEH